MILNLVDINDPVLRKNAIKVIKLDKKINKLIADMKETLKSQDDPEGVGLAAPQVGKSLQIFFIMHEGLEQIIINPKVLKRSKTTTKIKKSNKNKILEGCLSLPHYYGPIARTNKITISFRDENWQKQEKTYDGFFAQIVEHELDHLKGVLFIDHILDQKQPLYKVSGDEWEEVELI